MANELWRSRRSTSVELGDVARRKRVKPALRERLVATLNEQHTGETRRKGNMTLAADFQYRAREGALPLLGYGTKIPSSMNSVLSP